MSAAPERKVGFVPWAWALSPLVTALLLTLSGSAPRAADEPVSWSLAPDDGGTALPTPAAARAALRDELPSGRVLYQRLGRLVARGPGASRDHPALSIELVAPGGESLFQALRSPYFGAADLPLTAALSASLANEPGASRLVVAQESAAGLSLKLEGGPPYAAVSLIGHIDIELPAAPAR